MADLKRANLRRKQSTTINKAADNLSKAVGVRVASRRLIPTVERSGLQMRIATTESVSLCVQMKSRRRFMELESAIRSVQPKRG